MPNAVMVNKKVLEGNYSYSCLKGVFSWFLNNPIVLIEFYLLLTLYMHIVP
jgi:hypothetical protein